MARSKKNAEMASLLLVAELIKLACSLVATNDRRPARLVHLLRTSSAALVPAGSYLVMNLRTHTAAQYKPCHARTPSAP